MKKVEALFVFILFLTCLFAAQPAQCSGEHFQEGLSLLKAKRYDEAIEVYREIKKKRLWNRPSDPDPDILIRIMESTKREEARKTEEESDE